jgi:hypothetical protein
MAKGRAKGHTHKGEGGVGSDNTGGDTQTEHGSCLVQDTAHKDKDGKGQRRGRGRKEKDSTRRRKRTEEKDRGARKGARAIKGREGRHNTARKRDRCASQCSSLQGSALVGGGLTSVAEVLLLLEQQVLLFLQVR